MNTLKPKSRHTLILSKMKFRFTLAKAKREILEDIFKGIIPETIASFEDLHQYVDANYYGGFCGLNYTHSANFEFKNKIQTALDIWLKNNRQ